MAQDGIKKVVLAYSVTFDEDAGAYHRDGATGFIRLDAFHLGAAGCRRR